MRSRLRSTTGRPEARPGAVAPAAADGVPEGGPSPTDRWWLLRVLALVLVFALVAVIRSRQVDIPFRDPGGRLFTAKMLSTARLLVVFVVIDVVVRWLRARKSGATPWSVARHRWTLRRIGLVLAGLVGYFVVYLCYRNLKSWVAFLSPHDQTLRQWDRWLFFGHTPAVVLHDLLGQDVAARVLTAVYESFTTLVTVALVAALAFTPTVRQAYVFVVAAMWAWILGVGSYYLIPSIGPFHSASHDFAGLTHTSIQTTQATYIQQRDQLLAHPHAADAFAQISAFASLHCALTCLVWLMARYYGLRLLSWLVAVFLVGTMLATVYLGWHFAVDVLAGLTIAWISVQLGKLTVTGTVRTPPAASANP